MKYRFPIFAFLLFTLLSPLAQAQQPGVEVSADGHTTAIVTGETSAGGWSASRSGGVLYGVAPDWANSLRVQVGALQAVDMNGDGLVDLVVGCYHSDSYPPYPDWENLIYFNKGNSLEADPSWISTDEVSTGDIQVALIDDDLYPDVFAANGGFSMSPSVIYWGSASGPSTTPGWSSQEPGLAWNNYAMPFDFDHDGDIDVITANQGNSPNDPYRPIYLFFNDSGVLSAVPGWQSAEESIQNFLSFADYDGDGWEDLAVSKWANFESGIYANAAGTLQTTPLWTTGDTDTDKGVAWADVDHNGWPDLALGHDPTLLYANTGGSLAQVWSSNASYHGQSDLRFFDVDSDGDDDLAEINFADGKTHIYLNDDGTLESAPSWTYDSSAVGTAVTFGDINGDTLPDLIIGYSGEPSVIVFYARGLASDLHEIPAATGATIEFHIGAGAQEGGRNYLLVGSVSGTDPGTLLPGGLATIPLNRDWFTDFILDRLNTPLFARFWGQLDATGAATAELRAPPIASWVGTTIHFAYALDDPWDYASNAVAVAVVP